MLERATTATLIGESADAPGCYRFVHALIAHTLAYDLSATRRQRTHQRIAQALETRGADAAAQATHWIAATQPTDATKAIEYARRAGDDALDALAPDDALRWYRQALELLDRQPEPDLRTRCLLLLDVGRAGSAAQEPDFWQPITEAGRIARALGDDELIVRVRAHARAGRGGRALRRPGTSRAHRARARVRSAPPTVPTGRDSWRCWRRSSIPPTGRDEWSTPTRRLRSHAASASGATPAR